MSKTTLKGKTTRGNNNVGKTMGRSRGNMVYNDTVGRMVTPKIDAAIKKNQK